MKRISILLVTLLFSGCLYSNIRLPGPVVSDARYELSSEDFKILGTVEATGEITTWLGLWQSGGNGYSALYEEAKKKGGDELMNYVFEIESYSIITFIYNKATWKARATVIKYTDQVKVQ